MRSQVSFHKTSEKVSGMPEARPDLNQSQVDPKCEKIAKPQQISPSELKIKSIPTSLRTKEIKEIEDDESQGKNVNNPMGFKPDERTNKAVFGLAVMPQNLKEAS